MSKRRKPEKEPESTSARKDKTFKSTGSSKEGSKSKTRSTGKSAQAEEQVHTIKDVEEPKPAKPLTPDLDWNKTLPANHRPIQPWISTLARNEDPLVKEYGGTYETFLEEVYKATTDQLDWSNPEGHQYPHDLRKPLPLIPNSRGRRVIPFDHFINNDLAYLSGGVSSRTYATSVTKKKAAYYGHIKWIEDLVPNTMESACDVYSRHRIIAITNLKIVEWHNYKHLDWITVRRDDDKLYTFKEGNYKRLRL
ncbi:hypothetical protein Tco_0828194 [Tanacetum coccineum]